MSKPKYTDSIENAIWSWFNQNQITKTFSEAAKKYGISEADVSKLHLLWSTGARDSFNQAVHSLFEGSPS